MALRSDARALTGRNTSASLSTPQSTMNTSSRMDIHAPIHKALRVFMNDTMLRLSRLNLDGARDLAAGPASVPGLICTLSSASQRPVQPPAMCRRTP